MKCKFWTEIETKIWLCQLAASPHLLVWKAKKGPFLLFNQDIFFFLIRQSSTSFLLPPTPQKNIPSCCWPILAVRQLTAWITQGCIVSLQEPATLSASLGIRAHYWAVPAHQVLSWSWKSQDNRQSSICSSQNILSWASQSTNQLQTSYPSTSWWTCTHSDSPSYSKGILSSGFCPGTGNEKLLAAWEISLFHFYY